MLKPGDKFIQTWTPTPMTFEVLDINERKDEIRVMCTSYEGYSHEETWDDLHYVISALSLGDYQII